MNKKMPEHYEYKIKSGDSLSLLMAKAFAIGPKSPAYKKP